MFDISNITGLIYSYGYLGIFVSVFLESSFLPPLPGDSLLFSVGLFASLSELSIVVLIISIFLGTFLGNLLAYEIGRNLVKLHRYTFWRKIFRQENIDKAHKFFETYGKVAVTFARFVPFMRTFVPVVAGIANMHYPTFVRYNALGALLWSTFVPLLGYFLGEAYPAIKDYIWLILILFVLVAVVPVIIEFFRRLKSSS